MASSGSPLKVSAKTLFKGFVDARCVACVAPQHACYVNPSRNGSLNLIIRETNYHFLNKFSFFISTKCYYIKVIIIMNGDVYGKKNCHHHSDLIGQCRNFAMEIPKKGIQNEIKKFVKSVN